MSPCPATYDSPPNYTTFSSPVLVVPFLNPSFMTHPPEEVQSLTGMISSSSTPYGSPAHEPTKGWLHRRTQLELGLLAALLAAVTAAIAVSVRFAVVERAGAVRGCIPPSCVHALGGGHVRSGGSIDSVTADRCKQELHAYADTNGGEYWKVGGRWASRARSGLQLPVVAWAARGWVCRVSTSTPCPETAPMASCHLFNSALCLTLLPVAEAPVPSVTWEGRVEEAVTHIPTVSTKNPKPRSHSPRVLHDLCVRTSCTV